MKKKFKGHSKWTQTLKNGSELSWELRLVVLCVAYPVKGKDGYGASVDGVWHPATIEYRQLLLDGVAVGIVFTEVPEGTEVVWE